MSFADDRLSAAVALHRSGQLAEAESAYRALLASEPRRAPVWQLLGILCYQSGRAVEAVSHIERAVSLEPDAGDYLTYLGAAYDAAGRYDEAVATLRSAVSLAPHSAQAHANLGMVLIHDLPAALRDQARLEEAATHLRRAADLGPGSAGLYTNLGVAMRGLGRIDEAKHYYQRAIDLDPNLADAYLGRGVCRLTDGELPGGFEDYEWRWRTEGYRKPPFSQPRWNGEALDGRTILLFAEQGLGDTLQFVRFASQAKRRGGRVVVQCQSQLVKLLAMAPGIDQLWPLGVTSGPFDVYAPLLDLPNILRLSLNEIVSEPYLAAEPRLEEQWRQRLSSYQGLRVGIGWQGDATQLFDHQRSIPLAAFAPLSQVSGVKLFSLQKGRGTEQLPTATFDVINFGAEIDEREGPFLDTAAVMKNLDLVITADTSLAHLAGSLGVPVWIALSANPDWRWMRDRADSPWYASARLFRAASAGTWPAVFTAIATELSRLNASRL